MLEHSQNGPIKNSGGTLFVTQKSVQCYSLTFSPFLIQVLNYLPRSDKKTREGKIKRESLHLLSEVIYLAISCPQAEGFTHQ